MMVMLLDPAFAELLAVSVNVLLLVAGLTLNDAVTPLGNLPTFRVTL